MPIISCGEVIQYIKLAFKANITKEFDVQRIRTNEIIFCNIETENPDFKLVSKLLKNLSTNQLEKLDLVDTFEIELDNKSYYTIVDMEDGNYIAIDKKRSVYRLNHDHQQPVQKVFDEIDEFFNSYNGNKDSIDKLFD